MWKLRGWGLLSFLKNSCGAESLHCVCHNWNVYVSISRGIKRQRITICSLEVTSSIISFACANQHVIVYGPIGFKVGDPWRNMCHGPSHSELKGFNNKGTHRCWGVNLHKLGNMCATFFIQPVAREWRLRQRHDYHIKDDVCIGACAGWVGRNKTSLCKQGWIWKPRNKHVRCLYNPIPQETHTWKLFAQVLK